MITKERLEELIEQGALIFYILNNSVALLRLNNSYGISIEEYNKEHNCKPQFYHSGNVYQNICDADKIFETEEDARWELEMTATRMETLKLPTWEEFCELDELIPNFRISFISKDEENCSLYFFNGICESDPKEIILWNQYIDDKIIFEKVATKENYIEACKLCLRLFKGEEV